MKTLKIGIVTHPTLNPDSLRQLMSLPDVKIVRMEMSEAKAELGKWPVDLLVSVGGDGTFLTTARIAAAQGLLMTGVRVPVRPESKPFLPDIELNKLEAWLTTLRLKGFKGRHVRLERRHFLKAAINGGPTYLAINEVSMGRGGLHGTVTVDASICEGKGALRPVHRVRADLTMVATATGSTGYALSTGGPVMHPEEASVVLTHVAAIGFGHRPLVLPGKYAVELKLIAAEDASVSFDCQNEISVEPGDVVHIDRGFTYTVLRSPAWCFFERARDVLNWGR